MSEKNAHNRQKKVAVVNDFCGFGRCSLTVALPLISACGLQCCPLPTAVFSNHTGFESFTCTDFTPHMEAYFREWQKLGLTFDGILTGFLGSSEQVGLIRHFLQLFKTEKTVTVIDPVMGDYGKLYRTYPPALAKNMRTLLPYADILTPNFTEACILTDTPYTPDPQDDCLAAVCAALHESGPRRVVISGLERDGALLNFVSERGLPPVKITVPKVGECRSGTGDVFSAVITADVIKSKLSGKPFADAVQHAADYIVKVLQRTVELQLPATDGLCFEEFMKELS